MSVLLLSNSEAIPSLGDILSQAAMPTTTNLKHNNWHLVFVDLKKDRHYCLEYASLDDSSIVFLHFGLVEIKETLTKRNDWGLYFKETYENDLVFADHKLTVTDLINSFLYVTPLVVGDWKSGAKNFAYANNTTPAIIFLFTREIGKEFDAVVNAALGIDEFGNTARKVYVIAIPVAGKPEQVELLLADYSLILAKALRHKADIASILSIFPGSKHYGQKIQFESDDDEDTEIKNSLKEALKIPLENNYHNFSEYQSAISSLPAELITNLEKNVPEVIPDEVKCTVYSPETVFPGAQFLIQLFAHTAEQEDSLDGLAKAADHDAVRRVSSDLETLVSKGSKLDFQLSLPGMAIEEPLISLRWKGTPGLVQFGVNVPKKMKQTDVIGKIIVLQNSVPIGILKFKLTVAGDNSLSREPGVTASAMTRFKKAFLSYCNKDLDEVLKRVQMLSLAKISFFQDLLTLEPGELWEKHIYDYIRECDVFFLFWSTAASRSKWVKSEINYALETQHAHGDLVPEILPVLIEGPPPPKPPQALKHLQFNDKYLYFSNRE